LDENSVKGNIVRIIFDKDYGTTTNQDIIDNILKCEPFLYSVNFTNIDSEDGEIVSDDSIEMDSKEQIVEQFIDSQAFPTNIHIGMLKSMFMKLMREAGETGIKIRTAEGTKIECESVGFQNFLSFGSVWQDIPLHNGVNFVTGIDMDKGKSNGAGKSSFLETIPFALFGKTARDIKQDQIINWKNRKNCQVIFRFKINEDIYEINRKLKPNVLEIFKNGDLIDQDAHKMDYQSMFEEIFGMDVKMFMSLVHSNVNSSANILSMKKAEKRKFLERMFGLEIYSKMNELSNSKLRSVEEKRYKIDTDISASDDKVESAVRMRIKFDLEIKSKQKTLESVQEVEEELERLKEKNPTLNADIETATKDKSTLNDELNKIINVFGKFESTLDTEILHMKKEIEKIEDQEEQRKKNKKIQKQIDTVVQKAGTIEEITGKIDKLHVDESGLSEKVDKENKNISVLEKELVELRTDLKNIETNLDLLAEGKCPVCGQDVKDPKTHYTKEQTTFKKKIAQKEKTLASLNENKSLFTTAWDEIKEKIKTLAKIKEALYKLKGEIKQVDSEEKKDDLKKEYEAKLIEIDDLRVKYKKKRKEYDGKIEALDNKLEDLGVEQGAIKVKEKEVELVKTEAKVEKKNIISLKGMIKEQDDLVELAKSKKSISESNLVRLNDIKDYLNVIKNILKDENIKQFTIKQIMPFVNKQTNYYLSEVNYSFYVKIDKWLDVQVKGPGIRNATYHSLSGGERRGIDIAIQLSLLDVSRTQAGVFPDLLTFDELLDSSIDSRGINELLKIVKVKQKEFGGKVFIISHRDEIDSEMIDFQYKVVKQDGFSKVII
jgi:DNA repair exonuclease SbcCD ATPase subunit